MTSRHDLEARGLLSSKWSPHSRQVASAEERLRSSSPASRMSFVGATSFGQEKKFWRFLSELVWPKLKSTSGGGTRPENAWKSSEAWPVQMYRSQAPLHPSRTEIRQICILKHLINLNGLATKTRRNKFKAKEMTKSSKFLIRTNHKETKKPQQPISVALYQKINQATLAWRGSKRQSY